MLYQGHPFPEIVPVGKFPLVFCKQLPCLLGLYHILLPECAPQIVHIINGQLMVVFQTGVYIPGNSQIHNGHRVRKKKLLHRLFFDGVVGTGGSAEDNVHLGKVGHPLLVGNGPAAGGDNGVPPLILPQGHQHLTAPAPQLRRRQPAHLSVADNHTLFIFQGAQLFFQQLQGAHRHGAVYRRQAQIGFYPLGRRHRIPEQHLQHRVRTLVCPGKANGLLHLGENLVFSKNLGAKAAGQLHKIVHRLFTLPVLEEAAVGIFLHPL